MTTKTRLFLVVTGVLVGGLYYFFNSNPIDDQSAVEPVIENSGLNKQENPNTQSNKEVVATDILPENNDEVDIKSLSDSAYTERELITDKLLALKNCKETQSCPQDLSDPRAGAYLLAMQLKEQLEQYTQLHTQNEYFDESTAEVTREFITYPDGHVQAAALTLMSAQPANYQTADMLIVTLENSYDGKVMDQALSELQRYPELDGNIENLLTNTLQTGAFNTAQVVAKNIMPFLRADNLEHYRAIAKTLPRKSAKARYLMATIKEFELRLTGG